MKIPLSIAVLSAILLVAACSPVQTVIPGLSPAVDATNPGVPSQAQTSQANPPAGATQVPANPNQAPNSGPIFIRVDTPLDNSTVNTPQIEVAGVSSAGAVVTVNDNIIIVGADGQFKTTIALDEGPNLIEIIASNDSGNETSVELTVTYEP